MKKYVKLYVICKVMFLTISIKNIFLQYKYTNNILYYLQIIVFVSNFITNININDKKHYYCHKLTLLNVKKTNN